MPCYSGFGHHWSSVGRRTENVANGFRIMVTPELPVNEILSSTIFPIVKLLPPEPPANVRQLVLLPQLPPLPLWKKKKPEKMKLPPPPKMAQRPPKPAVHAPPLAAVERF